MTATATQRATDRSERGSEALAAYALIAIPMVLFLVYVTARTTDRQEARAVAVGAYVAYLVSQFMLLALSRARESAADHWSCECTGDGDALASALVKIAYGMGQVSAEQKERVHALAASGKQGKKEAARLQQRTRRAQSMRAMGIFEPRAADAMAVSFARGIDPQRAIAAMRWDVVNPWGAVLEKLSSHPLVARRIQALEESGLPVLGAPSGPLRLDRYPVRCGPDGPDAPAAVHLDVDSVRLWRTRSDRLKMEPPGDAYPPSHMRGKS